MGIRVSVIGKEDLGRIAEFDALFIRVTTGVNHYTYRFASRAVAEGLVVMDDPESIVRCSNKVYQAELLLRHGLPCPKTLVVHRDNAAEAGRVLGFPVVLKRPDSSFSLGVVKAETASQLAARLDEFFETSELVVAQEYLPSGFDWRIGVLDGQPLFACRYHMAKGHWQIQKVVEHSGRRRYGKVETLAVRDAPARVVTLGVRAANLIGRGLYGVDIKETPARGGRHGDQRQPEHRRWVRGHRSQRRPLSRGHAVLLRPSRAPGRGADMTGRRLRGLFEGVGIELEYMIVDRKTLAVRPIADEALKALAGTYETEVELGGVAWSNELALHVLELKTVRPRRSLDRLSTELHRHVTAMMARLEAWGATLLPTAMHPWMDPDTELRLWPHEQDLIYRTFDRIFDCRGHGWANLQSMHVNLPFATDADFGRLHAAMRLLLPILPALAAGSPVMNGRTTGLADTRLDVYRHNADRVPSVVGQVVPEPVFSRSAYEEELLGRIYTDLAPHDPEGVLRHEWVNARGCIARFDRSAIELRVLDVQECPRADLAIAAATTAVLQALVEERWGSYPDQRRWSARDLDELLVDATRHADQMTIRNRAYLASLGWSGDTATGTALWTHLVGEVQARIPGRLRPCLDTILEHGCLARRILRALGTDYTPSRLHDVYARLHEALDANRMFIP